MNGIFQIIRKEDGARSKAFKTTAHELALLLAGQEVPLQDYVLLVIDEDFDEVPTAPLISVESFMLMHDIEFKKEEVSNG